MLSPLLKFLVMMSFEGGRFIAEVVSFPEAWLRFIDKVEIETGPLETDCWLWCGARSRGKGNTLWYGSFWDGEKMVRAHKWSFVNIGRGLLKSLQPLDHLCENSLCVRPCHLEAVTREINQARKSRNFNYDRRH